MYYTATVGNISVRLLNRPFLFLSLMAEIMGESPGGKGEEKVGKCRRWWWCGGGGVGGDP